MGSHWRFQRGFVSDVIYSLSLEQSVVVWTVLNHKDNTDC